MHDPDATSSRPQDNECWNAAATGWEAERERMWEASRAVGEGLIEMAAPAPGEVVLELAAGSGDTGFLAARLIGDQGVLITSDRSAAMLDSARRRAGELGVSNAEFREVDAERIDLASASVDVVLCRWGYMLLDDPLAGLRETRRVLRPGGRVAFAVWAPRTENPWSTVIFDMFDDHGLLPPTNPADPGPFRLGDRDELATIVSDAGLELAEMRDLPVLWRYADADDYWQTTGTISPALSKVIPELPAATADALRAELAERSRPYADADGSLRLPGVSIGVLAR